MSGVSKSISCEAVVGNGASKGGEKKLLTAFLN